MSASVSGRAREFTERERCLLDEHQYDTCEYEMGQCLGGCRGGCPPAYCTSEKHKTYGVTWPCNVVAPILGYRNADAYWKAENERLDALYAAANVAGQQPQVAPRRGGAA